MNSSSLLQSGAYDVLLKAGSCCVVMNFVLFGLALFVFLIRHQCVCLAISCIRFSLVQSHLESISLHSSSLLFASAFPHASCVWKAGSHSARCAYVAKAQ